MKILAIESSASACSVAVCQDERRIAQFFQNNGLTHSRTLMPMVEGLLAGCESTLADMDVIAVACGPGSFTGLRIGVSTAKGLAWGADKPCAPCSTLASMAWQVAHMDALIVPVMDARRNQVYNALFQAGGGTLERLCPDRAIGLDELTQEVKKYTGKKILVGDGAKLCYNEWKESIPDSCLAPEHLRWQTAWGVACEARKLAMAGQLVPADELRPFYHRISQAERERIARLSQQTKE